MHKQNVYVYIPVYIPTCKRMDASVEAIWLQKMNQTLVRHIHVSIATGVIVVLTDHGRNPASVEILLKTQSHQFELYVSLPSSIIKCDCN